MARRDNCALSIRDLWTTFVKFFHFIFSTLRDGLRTVAHLVVKSTWIIISRIQSSNPASAFVITFISCQGHNSGKDSSSAIRAKVHELFRISDKYRWGNETRRIRTRIKMVFVLADKLPGHSQFCNLPRPKTASFTSKWRVFTLHAIHLVLRWMRYIHTFIVNASHVFCWHFVSTFFVSGSIFFL